MNEKDIIRTLKSERCPPSVLKRVQAMISSEKSYAVGWRWKVPVGISVAAATMLLLVFIHFNNGGIGTEEIAVDKHTRHSIDETVPALLTTEDYLAEAERLKYVFAYIGLTLAEETERNRDIIFSNTIPIVKNSITNTEEFINNKIRGRKL